MCALFWKLAVSSDFRRRGIPEARGLAESIRAVRALPRESGSAAAEVAVSSGGLVNRTAQVERLNDRLGRQREKFADEGGDIFFRHIRSAEVFRHDGDRLCNADR